jgi:uncharacterized protein YqgV (UPF0045/DUF77 family)
MSNKKNILLIKIHKREINTDVLYNAMQKIQNNPIMQQGKSIKKEDFIEKMAKLKEKIEIKNETKSYETIQENLNESLRIMKELNANFKILKEKSLNIDIKVEEKLDTIDKINIDKLNINNKGLQDIKIIDKKLNNNYIDLEQVDQEAIKISKNIKKGIFDIEWLQPFLDFMHNHSTLVLTIGSGLVMGGMWYMNNVGYINIGNLLTRLGIQIFSPTAQNNPNSAPSIALSSETPRVNPIGTVAGESNDASSIGRGFFRQLGEKVLKLIEALIVKLESKQQKYK